VIMPVSLKCGPQELAAAIEFAVTSQRVAAVGHAQDVANQYYTSEVMARNWGQFLRRVCGASDEAVDQKALEETIDR